MCTAYEIGKKGVNFPKRISRKAVEELRAVKERRLMRPTLMASVVDLDGGLVKMRWGFRREFSNAVVNARQDKLKGRMWREAMEERRCLIPAAAYYEWSGPKGAKRTHRFESPAGEWLWIAGIWEEDVELGRCFSMITTEPRGAALGVHDRMPAVLSEEETGVFLDGGMWEFHPAAGLLEVRDAVNPLTGKAPPPVQGELF
ncbi:SOS response-associated peptidase family protein [Luteolibacter sp. AS25]|uniref:SOS response-associated peptidase family protein n=1 Tax=Luteolibacter sp. AS25 TaxID=3135776 RepID=UPI00398A8E5F